MRTSRHDDPGDSAFELDPDTLKAAEFFQVRMLLDAIVGKTIASARIENDRTSITTTDGTTLVFCEFGGSVPEHTGT